MNKNKNKNKTIVKTDSRDYFQEFFSYDIIFISINLPEIFGRTPSEGWDFTLSRCLYISTLSKFIYK